jgi:hypothetical protein
MNNPQTLAAHANRTLRAAAPGSRRAFTFKTPVSYSMYRPNFFQPKQAKLTHLRRARQQDSPTMARASQAR